MFSHKTIYGFSVKHPILFKNILNFILFCIYTICFFRHLFFSRRKSVLYAGQAYYNAWYLSRELRKKGWRADVLNWDLTPGSQIYYHGEDHKFKYTSQSDIISHLDYYLRALIKYDIFHFSNTRGIILGFPLNNWFKENYSDSFEIYFLKKCQKVIVYSNNGCLDGVSQTAFSKWGPSSTCSICNWRLQDEVCSDKKNLEWGKFRNEVADYQCLLGGNRIDYNLHESIHEVPEFYCLDASIWSPNLSVPKQFSLPPKKDREVRLYHAVGNEKERTDSNGINIKSTHVYLPLVNKLKNEGYNVTLISPSSVPNIDIRFYQMQADIFLEMLSFGWFGANAREAMMLGKPVICFIRPEWLESVRQEIPEYAETLPIITATPETIETILKDLILNQEKREEIGRRSRDFAMKWHSSKAGAKRFNDIYLNLLNKKRLSKQQ